MRHSLSLGKEAVWLVFVAFNVALLPAMVQGQEPSRPQPPIIDAFKFDEWGDLPFTDERVRLDNVADDAKAKSLSIVYLIIHAGQTSCVDEAKARAVRAKNYLVSRGISQNRIVWIDAGWRKSVWIVVWVLSPEMGKPIAVFDDDLKPDQVKLQRNCKIKYRGH